MATGQMTGGGSGVSAWPSEPHSCGTEFDPADGWQLDSLLDIAGLPSSVAATRRYIRQLLGDWGLDDLKDHAELLVSELTTNAVVASAELAVGGPIQLRVLSDKARIAILVSDVNPRPPVRLEAGGDSEGGRGLALVDALSDQWGWFPRMDRPGKVVWCVIQPGGLGQ